MAVRASMSDLITRVRVLIGDTQAAPNQQFDDQTVQDILDLSRVNVRSALLRPSPSPAASGLMIYRDYYADVGNWEADVTIQDGAFNILSDMATSDYLTGHWTWNLPSPGRIPPLFITGQYYDIYCAAADLLERWAAVWTRAYSMTVDGTSLQRASVATAMLAQAKQYRRQQLVHSLRMYRPDVEGDASSDSVLIGNDDLMGWGE